MLTDEIKQKIEAATVKIIMEDDGFGSGVLIPGRMILTATHCVQHTADGGMAIGDYYIETLETSQGFLKAAPIMVECVSDLAVLGGLDGQEFWDELTAFDAFCETVEPVGIHLKEVHPCMPFPAYLRTREGEWMSGEATIFNAASPIIAVAFSHAIPAGTSGSPIVNDDGQIVGIVSNSSENPNRIQSSGSHPFPAMVLPWWILKRIRTGQSFS